MAPTARSDGADRACALWASPCWRAVIARCPDPHPFQTLEWQRAWWETFGGGQLIVWPVVAADGAPGAVVALVSDAAGVVRIVGSGDLTDYPSPAIAPGHVHLAAATLIDRLLAAPFAWRALELRNARPEDGLARALREAADARGLSSEETPDEPVAVAALPSSFEDHLRGLSKHRRHELRRKRARLARALPGSVLRRADAATLEADLDAFLRLHRLARGDKGRFMSAQVEAFFRRVADEFMALGWLRLDLLEHAGRPLAATFAFQSATTYYLYNMAFDPAARTLAPGIVLLGALIERAIAEGLAQFDFLRGLERYKLELGGEPRRLTCVRVLAPHPS